MQALASLFSHQAHPSSEQPAFCEHGDERGGDDAAWAVQDITDIRLLGLASATARAFTDHSAATLLDCWS